MKDFVEEVLSQTITEVSEGAVGRSLEEIEATEEAEPGVVAKSRGKFPIRANLTQIDKKLSLKQRDSVIAICSLRAVLVFLPGQRMNERPVNVIKNYLNGIIPIELKGSLVGSEGELISYFHKTPPMLFG
jgi:hypothetical protein